MEFSKKDLLGIYDMTKEEIEDILEISAEFKKALENSRKKLPTLQDKTIINLFYEPSTRTRISFELAAKRLSADVINIYPSTSSISKGESLRDTLKTLEAMHAYMIVIRHYQAGIPHLLAKNTHLSIINAGDNCHEHPTQALVDIFTLKEKIKDLKGLRVLIVGDILHSRVARSDIFALTKFQAKILLCGPPNLIPHHINKLNNNIYIYYNLDEAIKEADVVIILRIQFERKTHAYIPSIKEYNKYFCLTMDRLKLAKRDILIMHPGPVNRNIEIESRIVDSPKSLIQEQVTNGIAVRMGVLYLLAKRKI